MDEILYLEPDEEITSVIDKVKQSQATRLSLVVPRDATLLQSVVNLRLLLKETLNLKKQIAIVTQDKIGRNLAAKVGLEVYDSIRSERPEFIPAQPIPNREEVIEIDDTKTPPPQDIIPKGVAVHHFQDNKKAWAKPEKIFTPQTPSTPWEKPKVHKEIDPKKLKKLLWPIFGIIVLLILIGAFLILPRVKVILQVKAEPYDKELQAQISGDSNATNIASTTYGGKLIDITQEKEEKFTTTGKKNLGGKASGSISLYNNWDSTPQSIEAGAKFSSSSKTFVAKDSVTIPGTAVKGGNIVPGTASVEIEAEDAGEEYNVKAGRFTIVGLSAAQQEKIYGQSSKDLTGGFSKEVQVVSADDYAKAKEKLTKELNEDFKKELATQAGGLQMIDDAQQIDIVEETTSAKVDTEAQDFTLKIKERLRQIVYSKKSFEDFIMSVSEKQISSDKMITLGPNGSIAPKLKEKKYDQNLIILDLKVAAKISSRLDTDKITEALLGKTQAEAQKYLDGLEGLSGNVIQYRPSWWLLKRIPNYKANLKVELDYLEPEVLNPLTPTISPELSPQTEVTP